ncbi:FAD-binding and (Fe-S)-binding domain-containing protein [Actinomadura welshii]|uniref:FAD-binding and (Fe-S)-binding domain-containing protein n=2 Tax=Actinomadura livida TaxID=79909 RepID=A0A7W7ID77_9ACTN|nr:MULTISPECIES: FAD-binding and (Fe-S)-binding domain-containing protein [Actinomadura]MBB4774957.1 FAD/FMN-containing dehydrogenase/Fe-S oxidoreductase [Actinomadura catellatispora]GGU04879.1 oxidoreductase [Actinomadura livida]
MTDHRELVEALRRAGASGVDDSALARAMYSSDASLYRVPPRVVVTPREAGELPAVLGVCREAGVPLTMRGGGTSIAGNAVGPGVVVDVSRHLNRVLEIDPEAGTALVEPGIVQARLHEAAAAHGLRFGPDPSTRTRATLGGMIGNNACGSRALGYGRTSDNVLGLDVVTGSGERLGLGDVPGGGGPEPAVLERLRGLVDANLALIRTEFGRFGRQVSGYSLEHLLPEKGFDVARALVGSEGTLALTLAARLRMVREPGRRLLAVLGFGSMAEAADAVPAILPHGPVACEGLDSRITGVVRERRGADAVPPLPRGSGWLLVELAGPEAGPLRDAARKVAADSGCTDSMLVEDMALADALWRIREDGSGLVARTPEGEQAHAGWEDAAVPPERLGVYLREFEALLAEYRLFGVPYGHFGDGCIHVRIDFPLGREGGRRVFRDFLGEAAALAARHGGTMSGEHGDGRARSELLPHMYSAEALALCAEVKDVFDPGDVLNPGIIVRPAPVDGGLRAEQAVPLKRGLALAYRDDRGDLSRAVHRCTGVGKCRADNTAAGGVMCPSYLATREEKDSTRGRARVLQEVVSGKLGPDGWKSAALHDVLDLCLSCKGCASDCPTGIDMASYKAEALHRRYRRRIRPRAHYALGWLPRWTRLLARVPALIKYANAGMRAAPLRPAVAWSAGIDRRRTLPAFAPVTFRRWFASRRGEGRSGEGRNGEVVLFVDTFTDAFSPDVGKAAVRVLEHAGYRVGVTERPVCCGITWISTGQLAGARAQARRTVRALLPHVRRGAKVVGLEPSCTGVLRSDAEELLSGADAAAAREVAAATRTLAELLAETPGWTPPDLSGVTGIAQPHCHHHAVMGWTKDAALLRDAGAEVGRLGGCCGLAGNFGVEKGHHDVSVAVAEHRLLPAVRRTGDGEVVLADGFSCRTQLRELADRDGEHLAQLLARHLPDAGPR